MHWLMTVIRLLFSRAAATLSLSANCLLTATSDECVPGVISTVTLKRGGRDLSSLTRIDSPISVAMLQCGIVGVKFTNTSLFSLSTLTKLCCTTWSSSRVRGCSGSFMSRIRSAKRVEMNTSTHANMIGAHRRLHAHRMDRWRCHPDPRRSAFCPQISCTHLDSSFRFPFRSLLITFLNWNCVYICLYVCQVSDGFWLCSRLRVSGATEKGRVNLSLCFIYVLRELNTNYNLSY